MHHIKPTITSQKGKQKTGKGFSLNELKAAGVTKHQARLASLPVDVRRKSKNEANVDAIKAHIKKA